MMGLEVGVWCAVMEFGWALQALDGNRAVFSKRVACKRTRAYVRSSGYGSEGRWLTERQLRARE